MARRKTLPESVQTKYSLAERLSALRDELYGDRGGPELARQLGLPVRTWYNYESGVTVPAEVVLRIIELTSVEPIWLLHGRGPKFRVSGGESGGTPGGPSTASVGSLLRSALQILERGELTPPNMVVARADGPGGPGGVVLLAVDDPPGGSVTRVAGPRYVAAKSEWLDAERECRCTRIEGDAMSPIVADGAYVAFAKDEEAPADLDGRLVVAEVEGRQLVRWFQDCGRYAVLRAENPAAEPLTVLVDLDDRSLDHHFRRVLWINTPH